MDETFCLSLSYHRTNEAIAFHFTFFLLPLPLWVGECRWYHLTFTLCTQWCGLNFTPPETTLWYTLPFFCCLTRTVLLSAKFNTQTARERWAFPFYCTLSLSFASFYFNPFEWFRVSFTHSDSSEERRLSNNSLINACITRTQVSVNVNYSSRNERVKLQPSGLKVLASRAHCLCPSTGRVRRPFERKNVSSNFTLLRASGHQVDGGEK